MNRNLLVPTTVILLLAFFIGANFIYQPKVNQMKQLTAALDQEEELGTRSAEVSSLEKRLQSYESRLMEKEKEEAELIDRIRKIANEVPIRVLSMTPESERSGDRKGPHFISLRIVFEGSYHQLGHFVAEVENSEKFMRVDALRFTAAENRAAKPIIFEVGISTLSHH